MPLPGTRVIPDGWEAHHQPTAEGQMTAAGTFTRQADAASFDEVAGRSVYPAPTTVYAGPLRFQASQRLGAQRTIGDRTEPIKRYQVGVPISAGVIQVNDVCTITAATDTAMVGRKLIVMEIPGGSLLWQQDLVCEEWQPTSR